MSALDKLINLLEQVKVDVPELQDKAASALDVLLSDDEPEESEGCFEQPEPEPELEPEPEPEPRDERYIPVAQEDIERILKIQNKIANSISNLGILVQNFEADKENILEEIEKRQTRANDQLDMLNVKYDLPHGKRYQLLFPQNNPINPGEAAFVMEGILKNE